MKKITKTIAVLALVAIIAGGMAACAPAAPPVAEKKPLTVGVISTMQQDVGLSTLRGVEIAAEDINAAGGILGRQVRVVGADDLGSPDEGVKAIDNLVAREGAELVIGVFNDGVMSAILPRLAEYRIPFISSGTTSYLIPLKVHEEYDKYKGWFRVQAANDLFLVAGLLDFADGMLVKELGWHNVVIFGEKAAWTDETGKLLEVELAKLGLKVVDKVYFPCDEKDYSPYFRQVERSGADGIFALVAEAGATPVIQYARFKPNMPMVGIIAAAGSPEFYDDTGGVTGNVAAVAGLAWTSKMDAKTTAFVEKWHAKYKTRPTKPDYAGLGSYIALDAFRLAAERAGTLDFDALVTELEKTDYTMNWRVQFYGRDEKDPIYEMYFTHDVKYGPDLCHGVWVQWQGNDAYEIWPKKDAVRDFVNPEWMKK